MLAHEHSRQVLETLDRLRTIIADVEAERRGYLLTLDPSYLKAYGVSDESVRREAQALQALVAQRSVAEPSRRTSGADRYSKAARDRRHRQDGAPRSGLAALAMIHSMDEIRSQIDQMVDHERFLLRGSGEARRGTRTQQDLAHHCGRRHYLQSWRRRRWRSHGSRRARRRKAIEENVELQGDLQERDKKIRRLVDANIIGIIIWELEGRILEANDAFLRIVGIRP